MSLRIEKLSEEIRDCLANCFIAGRMNDPSLSSVSISHVKLSKDYKLATVYFRLYDEKDLESALKGLERAKGFLKKAISKHVVIRQMPDLFFVYDVCVDEGAKIEDLLSKARS